MAQKKGGLCFFSDRDHQWQREYRVQTQKGYFLLLPRVGSTGLVNRTGVSMGRWQERVLRKVGIPGLGRVWGKVQAEMEGIRWQQCFFLRWGQNYCPGLQSQEGWNRFTLRWKIRYKLFWRVLHQKGPGNDVCTGDLVRVPQMIKMMFLTASKSDR